HTSLRVAHQPERLDIFSADLFVYEPDDILQILVIGRGPDSRWSIGGGDHETVFIFIIHDREIVALPVSVRAAAVQAKNERHLLAAFQVAGIIEEEFAARLRLDRAALFDNHCTWALCLGTMQGRRGFAVYAGEL